ncbi:hypothetical protein ACHAW5_010499 [Stephanodiscus triporus]|uniref:Uncharacterized protein n=1 Tax=Stephanodiscus triporus TaxID=2934178 RepID=A0ABD3N9L9_9STRA
MKEEASVSSADTSKLEASIEALMDKMLTCNGVVEEVLSFLMNVKDELISWLGADEGVELSPRGSERRRGSQLKWFAREYS